jgi:hypothetical protein
MFDAIGTLHILGIVIGAAFSGWIVTMQVQRRMKKSLGRNATDLELASLKALIAKLVLCIKLLR